MLRIKTQEKFNRIYETESEILKPNTASHIHPLKMSLMLKRLHVSYDYKTEC